jgi:hypothetical protein
MLHAYTIYVVMRCLHEDLFFSTNTEDELLARFKARWRKASDRGFSDVYYDRSIGPELLARLDGAIGHA